MNAKLVFAAIAIALAAGVGAGQFSGSTSPRAALASPAFGFSFLFVGPASCSLATGVCTTTIVNTGTNSSYDLKVDGCRLDIITYSSNFYSVYNTFAGAVGGFVSDRLLAGDFVSRLPYGAVATSTCTLPTTMLTSEPSGQPATGYFTMELVNSLGSSPPGKNASVGFEGTWIAVPAPVTSTSTVTSVSSFTTTATSTVVSTTTTTATTTVTTGGVGILEFPYQLLAILAFVVLPVAAYLIGARRSAQRT